MNRIVFMFLPFALTTEAFAQARYNDSGGDGFGSFFMVLVILSLLLYFIPSIVASKREHPNRGAIYMLNILAGWTFIGWVGALVWAMTGSQQSAQIAYQHSPATSEPNLSIAEKIKEFKDLLDSGAITQDEFDALKAKAINNG